MRLWPKLKSSMTACAHLDVDFEEKKLSKLFLKYHKGATWIKVLLN